VNRLANALRTTGQPPGARIGLLATGCHRYFEVQYACAAAGFVTVPLNHRLIAAELVHILRDAEAGLCFAAAEFVPTLDQVRSLCPDLQQVIAWGTDEPGGHSYEDLLAGSSSTDLSDRPADADVAVIAYTSGTTGVPKGAMLTHHSTVLSAFCYGWLTDLRADDLVLQCMPAYVYRSGSASYSPGLIGAHVVVEPFEAGRVLSLIEQHRVSYLHLAPAMINMLLAHPDLHRVDISSVRGIWTGGAPIRPETMQRVASRFGDVLGVTYGMTEATGIASHRHSIGSIQDAPGGSLQWGARCRCSTCGCWTRAAQRSSREWPERSPPAATR
jgi:fatty-acyl-CoA synthase